MSISMINNNTLLPPQYQGRGVPDWRWKMAFGKLAPHGQSEELYEGDIKSQDDGKICEINAALERKKLHEQKKEIN